MTSDRGRSVVSTRLVAGLLLVSLVLLSALPALAAPAGQGATPVAGATEAPAGAAPGATPAAPGAPASPPDAVAGKAIFSASDKCAACHGVLGDGNGPAASSLGAKPTAFNDFNTVAGISLADMFNVAKNGRMDKMMPPWKGQLSDQQIWDTIGYAWTLHTTQQEVDNGKKIYDANCASCHGADGKGKNGAPDLTNFASTSTQSQNQWLQDVAKGKGQMPAFDGKLVAADQRAALEYVRSLSFTRMFRGPLPAGAGVITGTLVNATTGQIMANLPITLTIFDGQTVSENRPATSDASGKYKFSGLPTDNTLQYQVSTIYPAGVSYASDPTAFPTNTLAMAMPLHVFETTTDGSGISADQLHLIVDFDPASKMLQVAELAVFSHDSDRTYVGDKNHTVLRIDVPAGAQQLDISDGELGKRFVKTDTGFVDTLPLPPGPSVRQVLFRYLLPYSGDKLDLTHSFAYPAANVNVLVADAGEKVASAQLQAQASRQTQMGNFLNLTAQKLPANQPITLQFTNLSQVKDTTAANAANGNAAATPASSTTDRLLLIALVAIIAMVGTFLVAWPLMRRRQAAAAAGAVTGPAELDRQGLVDALAQLDLAHEAGELGDAEYRDQRVRLKARLLDLMRQEGLQ